MIDLRAVRRYAQALFNLSEQRDNLDKVDDQLLALRQLIEKHHEISNLMSNFTIGLAEKEDFIEKIVPQGTFPLLVNFLKVLSKKKRFKEFVAVQEEFHHIYEKKRRIEEITVVSAVRLSKQNVTKLENILKKKFNSEIRLEEQVDPKIIGGLILRYGGNEINASFKSRLEAIEQVLTA